MSFSNSFISIANAQNSAPDAAPQQSIFSSVGPLLIIFIVFYFFIIRPQNKKYKDQQSMTKKTSEGDTVVVLSGVFGKIVKINEDDTVVVELSKGSEVKMYKSCIVKNVSLEERSKAEALKNIPVKKK